VDKINVRNQKEVKDCERRIWLNKVWMDKGINDCHCKIDNSRTILFVCGFRKD
jgi:hypothetical protein